MRTHPLAYAPVLLLGLLPAACWHDSANYCADAPHHNCLALDAAAVPPDAACATSADCAGATPVCDLDGVPACVQCTASEPAACKAATPICGDNDSCRACAAHTECGSKLCEPDGSCAAATDVAYVDADGTNNPDCTQSTPCTRIATALATGRPLVKVHGTIDEQVSLVDRDVRVFAEPGAKLTSTTNGILLKVDGTSNVEIYDLQIGGASGASNPGISMQPGNAAVLALSGVIVANNAGGGIASAGGNLRVSRSTVSGNSGGGIAITGGTFAIVGNVFVGNGTSMGSVGGVSISTSQSTSNRLEFNSFNQNEVQLGAGAAIQCLAGTFTARNNIMSENGTLSNMAQTGGGCTHAYSIARPGTVPPGVGNSGADPMFANTLTGDLHISASSPARHAADPASDLTGLAAHDIDGDPRVSPADIGADQVP